MLKLSGYSPMNNHLKWNMLLVWQNIELFLSSFQMLSWDVGKINPQKLPSLKGTMSLQAGASKPDENPTINIQFKIQQMAISGTCTRFSLVVQEHCGHQVVPNALGDVFVFGWCCFIMLPLSILSSTGLKVNRLDMYGEKYKPFKGIKYMTKAGKFQVRT